MPSHTISVHFRCPLLLFYCPFSVQSVQSVHTCPLLFSAAFIQICRRAQCRNQSLANCLRNLIRRTGAVSCRKNAGKIRFHRTVNHDILAIRFQPKQQTFGGCAVFRKENPITGNRFSPHLQRGNPAILAKHRLRFSFL